MSDDKPRLVVTSEYQLYQLKPQGVYPVPESDWERIKRMIREIIPVHNWYQALAAMFFGVFVAAIFTAVSFSASSQVPRWAQLTTWSGMVIGFVLAPCLFFLDRTQKQSVTRSAKTVIDEMELMEEGYEKSHQPTLHR